MLLWVVSVALAADPVARPVVLQPFGAALTLPTGWRVHSEEAGATTLVVDDIAVVLTSATMDCDSLLAGLVKQGYRSVPVNGFPPAFGTPVFGGPQQTWAACAPLPVDPGRAAVAGAVPPGDGLLVGIGYRGSDLPAQRLAAGLTAAFDAVSAAPRPILGGAPPKR
jgi:hypothetical protein